MERHLFINKTVKIYEDESAIKLFHGKSDRCTEKLQKKFKQNWKWSVNSVMTIIKKSDKNGLVTQLELLSTL